MPPTYDVFLSHSSADAVVVEEEPFEARAGHCFTVGSIVAVEPYPSRGTIGSTLDRRADPRGVAEDL